MTFTHALSTNNYGTAKFIVSSNAANGTHTTIASALAVASSGDTIFLRAGTYTENLTLVAGVNLAAYECDAFSGNATIVGKLSFSSAGTVSISGIRLQTNSDYLLSVTGSAASIVKLTNCYLDVANNTAIEFSSSSSSASIFLSYCKGDTGTTGITYFSDSSAGTLDMAYCDFINSGASTTGSTKSAGNIRVNYCHLNIPLTYSSSETTAGLLYSTFDTSATNTRFLTTSGTGTITLGHCRVLSGTAATMAPGAGSTVACRSCIISSTNTFAIAGAGIIAYSDVVFSGSSQKISTVTQTGGTLQGGVTQAPSAGFLGEELRSAVTGVSISNSTAKTITSISITPGIWDVSAIIFFGGSAYAQARINVSISTVNNTLAGGNGDSDYQFEAQLYNLGNNTGTVPSYRVTLTSTTTYYLVGYCAFTSGTVTCKGRISATRVG